MTDIQKEPLPCPFDCGAKITPVDGSGGGLIKHQRAPGQRACPLNNAVTDLQTWNRRSAPSRVPATDTDRQAIALLRELVESAGRETPGERVFYNVTGTRKQQSAMRDFLCRALIWSAVEQPSALLSAQPATVTATTSVAKGIAIVTGTHTEHDDDTVTLSRREYEAIQATTKAELCADLLTASAECERLRAKLRAPSAQPAPTTRQTDDAVILRRLDEVQDATAAIWVCTDPAGNRLHLPSAFIASALGILGNPHYGPSAEPAPTRKAFGDPTPAPTGCRWKRLGTAWDGEGDNGYELEPIPASAQPAPTTSTIETRLLNALFRFVTVDNGYCTACHGHWTSDEFGIKDFFGGEHRDDCPIHVIRESLSGQSAQPAGEAGTDTARLDWLDTQREDVKDSDNAPDGDERLIARAWGIYGQHDTIREAIDAAMSSQPLPTTTPEPQ